MDPGPRLFCGRVAAIARYCAPPRRTAVHHAATLRGPAGATGRRTARNRRRRLSLACRLAGRAARGAIGSAGPWLGRPGRATRELRRTVAARGGRTDVAGCFGDSARDAGQQAARKATQLFGRHGRAPAVAAERHERGRTRGRCSGHHDATAHGRMPGEGRGNLGSSGSRRSSARRCVAASNTVTGCASRTSTASTSWNNSTCRRYSCTTAATPKSVSITRSVSPRECPARD